MAWNHSRARACTIGHRRSKRSRAPGIRSDAKGFVVSGTDTTDSRQPLETTRRGIFAIADVRSGSIKRVAAAVGEGAQVVVTLHAALAAIGTEPPDLRPTYPN